MEVRTIETGDAPSPAGLANYSQARAAGDFVWLAGQVATDFRGLPEECRRAAAFPYYGSDIAVQTEYIMRNLEAVLKASGSSLGQVAKAQVFMRDAADFNNFDEVYKRWMPSPPVRSTLAIGEPWGVLMREGLIEIDFLAARDGVRREVIDSPELPFHPVAGYSPVITVGDLVFPAGHGPIRFDTLEIPPEARKNPSFPFHGSDIELQTRYTLNDLKTALEVAGSDLEHVVKAQVFLRDLNDFYQMDEVWREFFPAKSPARTTIEVRELLVSEMLIEIDLIAVKTSVSTEVIRTDRIPSPLANYSPAVRAGEYIFFAGQLASDFVNGVAPAARVDPNFPFYSSAIGKQTDYILENCETLLEEAGSDLNHVVKAQVFLTNAEDFLQFDKAWKRHFTDVPPPRSTLEIMPDGLLVPGTLVEIDLTAVAR